MFNESFIFAPRISGQAPFDLGLAGTTWRDTAYKINRLRSPCFVLEAVSSGTGTLEINGSVFHPQQGDCYLLPLNSRHCYSSDPADPWVKHFFNFNGTMIPELLKAFYLDKTVLFRGVCLQELFKDRLDRLADLPLEKRQTAFPEIITGIFSELSARVNTSQEPAKIISPEGLILRDMLENFIASPSPAIAELAKKIGKSETQTMRIFKKDFGTSPVAFLIARKIEQAKNLLTHSSCSVKEIAAMLGFKDEFYFSRIFTKKCGVSPKQFRKNTEMTG